MSDERELNYVRFRHSVANNYIQRFCEYNNSLFIKVTSVNTVLVLYVSQGI